LSAQLDNGQILKYHEPIEAYRKEIVINQSLVGFIETITKNNLYTNNILNTVNEIRELWNVGVLNIRNDPSISGYEKTDGEVIISYILTYYTNDLGVADHYEIDIDENRRVMAIINKYSINILSLQFPVEIYILLILSYFEAILNNNKSLYYLNDNDNDELFRNRDTCSRVAVQLNTLQQFKEFDTRLDTLLGPLNKLLGMHTIVDNATSNKKRGRGGGKQDIILTSLTNPEEFKNNEELCGRLVHIVINENFPKSVIENIIKQLESQL
jgi:hypothetical protein